jgi:hypothetical protein
MDYKVKVVFGRKLHRVRYPGLMVAFAVAWGLLTILVVMQDHAIDAQRSLIQLLLQDLHKAVATSASRSSGGLVPVVKRSQFPSKQVQSQSTPSVQVAPPPSSAVQAPGKEASNTTLSQEKDTAVATPGKAARRTGKPLPALPPAEITDPSDMRRVTFSI